MQESDQYISSIVADEEVFIEEIAKHIGSPENLIDDAREMRYNDVSCSPYAPTPYASL